MLHVYLCYTVFSALYSIVIPFSERADPLALLCVVFSCFVLFCHFPIWYSGSGMVLDIAIPDICLHLYFDTDIMHMLIHVWAGSFIGE